MRDVRSRHRRRAPAETPQHRPRPAVSIPPLARQPAGTRNRGNQIRPLCPGIASVRRAADRYDPARVSRPGVVLECARSDAQVGGIPGLLQCLSRAPLARGQHACPACRRIITSPCRARSLWLAAVLPRPISGPSRRLIRNSPPTRPRDRGAVVESLGKVWLFTIDVAGWRPSGGERVARSEEHTSELQSHLNLVCRLLLEKKKN